jgi:hypothetical protein
MNLPIGHHPSPQPTRRDTKKALGLSNFGGGSVSGKATYRELTTETLRQFDHAIIANPDSGLMSYRKLADLRVQVGSGLEVKDSVAVGDFAAGIRKAAGT